MNEDERNLWLSAGPNLFRNEDASVNGIQFELTTTQSVGIVAILHPTTETTKDELSKARALLSQRGDIQGVIVEGESEWRSYGWRRRNTH